MWMENATGEFERCVSDEAFFIKPRCESRARRLSNRADRYKMLSSGRGKGETSLVTVGSVTKPTRKALILGSVGLPKIRNPESGIRNPESGILDLKS